MITCEDGLCLASCARLVDLPVEMGPPELDLVYSEDSVGTKQFTKQLIQNIFQATMRLEYVVTLMYFVGSNIDGKYEVGPTKSSA